VNISLPYGAVFSAAVIYIATQARSSNNFSSLTALSTRFGSNGKFQRGKNKE